MNNILHNQIDLQLFPTVNWCKISFQKTNIKFNLYQPYNKSRFSNRYQIAGADGAIKLSVPLVGGRDQKASIKELKIANDNNWQKQHWRTLVSCYGRSPFFEFYQPGLEPFFLKRYEFLADLQMDSLQWIKKMLKAKTKFEFSESEAGSAAGDLAEAEKSEIIYPQVFEDRTGFLPNLSILDLLFCTGPASAKHLSIIL
jgi:hypothetical protein